MIDAFYTTPDGLAGRIRAYQRAGAIPIVVPLTGGDPGGEIASLLRTAPWADTG
jgi:hypothetical protein